LSVKADVRRSARAWLASNWDPGLSLVEWRRRLCDAGWARPTWPPHRHGQGLPPVAATVVAEELERAGAVGPPEGLGIALAAPTILAHGTDEQQARFLRPILVGEERWCQLFSEPGCGSDLAGLTTGAERDGDAWRVTGQKVWTTGVDVATYATLLARTDWGAPKHRGLTYFAIRLNQPGIEVRPLRQMNGHASFYEVFLDGALVPDADRIGGVGDGWRVARTTLGHERAGDARPPLPNGPGRAIEEARAEGAWANPHVWYPQRSGRVDLLTAMSAGAPVARQVATSAVAQARTVEWLAGRAVAARAQGRPPGPEGSLLKLARSRVARSAAEAHAARVGAAAMLAGPDAPDGGVVAEVLLSVPSISIAGGTDEIQRNIIGERVLGLPREPDSSRDRPFRDVPTNASRPR
jgi:alkylation response protein AidB-like acyl-CoA dehydrogenase